MKILIVSDILMPKMDDFQLCRECKSDAALRAIPFIIYSGTSTEEHDKNMALGLGAQKYIVKPTKPGVFINLVQEFIGEAQAGRMPAATAPPEEEPVYLKQDNARL